MPLTPITAKPSIYSPDFEIAASTLFATQLPRMVDQLNSALLAFGPGNPLAANNGTPNAIILDSGLNLGALVRGQMVRFRAPNTNTGPAEINLDGLGNRSALTIMKGTLPPGYIRTDVDNFAYLMDEGWVVLREMQRGSNANGEWVREADGTLTCTHFITSSASAETTWTYPAAFINSAAMRLSATPVTAGTAISAARVTNKTATSVDVSVLNTTGRVAQGVDLIAIGRWYG